MCSKQIRRRTHFFLVDVLCLFETIHRGFIIFFFFFFVNWKTRTHTQCQHFSCFTFIIMSRATLFYVSIFCRFAFIFFLVSADFQCRALYDRWAEPLSIIVVDNSNIVNAVKMKIQRKISRKTKRNMGGKCSGENFPK